jgi:N-acyl-phosphatidylethanolamine-hydrolysing phospholipase D
MKTSKRRGFSLSLLSIAGAAIPGIACTPPEDRAPHAVSSEISTLYAPHGEKGSFFVPWGTFGTGVLDVLRWRFSRNPYDKSRPLEIPKVENDGADLAGVENSSAITWVGHATFAIHDGDDVALTDPHFGSRAVLPNRRSAPGIPIESIPPDAFAVISHNHYDHLDRYTVENLPKTVEWYVPMGLGDWFRDRGRSRVTELDWWESTRRGRWTITCLPSQHWSRRLEQRMNSTLWCSWLLDSGEYRYYFAGDTGYFHGFAEYGRRFTPIDVALLPIGAYEPRWFMRYQHMDPAEAYRAFLDLGARFMLPMHWGTFDLTDEPVDLPPRVFRQVISDAGEDPQRAPILAIGERWVLPD